MEIEYHRIIISESFFIPAVVFPLGFDPPAGWDAVPKRPDQERVISSQLAHIWISQSKGTCDGFPPHWEDEQPLAISKARPK